MVALVLGRAAARTDRGGRRGDGGGGRLQRDGLARAGRAGRRSRSDGTTWWWRWPPRPPPRWCCSSVYRCRVLLGPLLVLRTRRRLVRAGCWSRGLRRHGRLSARAARLRDGRGLRETRHDRRYDDAAGARRGRPGQGRSRSRSTTIIVPDPGPGEAVVRSRRAGSATPTCTTARAASTTTSRSCSATRPPASSRRSATASPSVAPGDFVVLNWRAVCGNCRACRARRAVVLLRHPQRHAEDDARRTAPSCPRRWASARSPRRPSSHAGQCTKVDPAARPGGGRPARLRRDGRHRRGDQHRRRRPRRLRRGDRLRRRGQRGRRRARRSPAPRRSSPSTSTTGSWSGPRTSAPPTP